MLKIFNHIHFFGRKHANPWEFATEGDAENSKVVQVILALAFIYVLVMILFAVSGIQLVKAASATCLDIKGQGTQVLVNGVPNSGVIDFDDAAIPLAYEACVEDPGNDGVGPFEVKGWAWDTNLGWVSFYCNGGSNLGAACGGVNYGVTINDAGEFSGYAWGDGIGWISFDNMASASTQVRVEVDDPACQGYIYGFTPPKAGCAAHGGNVTQGYRWTYAWSDNVKWIDFSGVLIPWFSVSQEVNDLTVSVTLGPDPAVIRKANNNVPIARASVPGLYILRIEIRDANGDPLDDTRYDFVVEPVWQKDTVKKNQTDDTITLGGLATPCTADAQRATDKPCSQGDFTHGLNTGDWSYDIYSIAPTSNMNGVTDPTTDAMLFSYEDFISPIGFQSGLEENDLIFTGMEISVYDTEADACAYGDNAACAEREICADVGCNVQLKFRPQTEITTFEQDGVPAEKSEVVEMSVGVPEDFNVVKWGGAFSSVNFTAGIDNSDPNVTSNLQFVNNDGGDGVYDFGDGWTSLISTDFTAAVAQQADSEVPTNFGGLYMYSVVSDPGGVLYFSNKLPREVGSSGIEPVAVLKGNVYTTGASEITTAAEAIRSLGDVSTNILRDTIYKNVSAIVAGSTLPTSGSNSTLVSAGGGVYLQQTVGNDVVVELMPDLLGNPRVYYARGSDVHIGQTAGADVTWSGNRTVIVIGGNVYIDNDLYNGSGSKAKLGIIALKDLSSPSAGDEGHVYIDKDVRNIQANIFADGSLFSYDADAAMAFNAFGEPQWGSLAVTEEALKYNQLFIEGSVASQNTLGGSGLNPPIKGDGTVAAAGGVEQARLYDLNFLRYYTGLIKKQTFDSDSNGALDVICKDAGGVDEIIENESGYKDRLIKTDGSHWSVYDTPPGCLWPPEDIDGLYNHADGAALDYQKDLGATYIYFDPPSADLPGFTAGAGVDVQVRPR